MEEKKNFKKINPYDLWLKEILIMKSLIFPWNYYFKIN